MLVKIFSSIDHASESIPENGIRLLIINGKKIAMARTNTGLYAFENECPHQFEPLHKGTLTAFNEVVCRLHHYRYNLQTGQENKNRCRPMNIYAIIIKASGVYIDL